MTPPTRYTSRHQKEENHVQNKEHLCESFDRMQPNEAKNCYLFQGKLYLINYLRYNSLQTTAFGHNKDFTYCTAGPYRIIHLREIKSSMIKTFVHVCMQSLSFINEN